MLTPSMPAVPNCCCSMKCPEPHWSNPPFLVFDIWVLRTDHQSVQMSKIKNDGLDQYGAKPFKQQQFEIAGTELVNFTREQLSQMPKDILKALQSLQILSFTRKQPSKRSNTSKQQHRTSNCTHLHLQLWLAHTCLSSVVVGGDRVEQRQTAAVIDQCFVKVTSTKRLVAFVLFSLGFHLLQFITQS